MNYYPLQQTATDILGLEFKELNHGLVFSKKATPIKSKYVVIGPESTAGCKEWPRQNWNVLAKLLNQQGYTVVTLTKNPVKIPGTINVYNKPFDVLANYLLNADLFIGLSSGLSWFNWGLGKKTVMMNGFTSKEHEFQTKVTRIREESVCNSCWINPNFKFDRGDWNWCPAWKDTPRHFECTKTITADMVKTKIESNGW